MKSSTLCNIFYELALFDSVGKESIIVKTSDFSIPSDFIRTEYIEFDSDFSTKINQFLNKVLEQERHYVLMSELLEADPVLSIDYLRSAYLISGDKTRKDLASRIFNQNKERIDDQSTLFIKNFLKS